MMSNDIDHVNPNNDKNPGGLRAARVLWLLFTLFILYGILIPFKLVDSFDALATNIARSALVPFMDPDGTRISIPDAVQNVLLFIPFGFFGFLSLKSHKLFRVVIVTILGVLFSICVEILQLLTVERTSSINDVITNGVGTFLGVILAGVVLIVLAQLTHSYWFQIHGRLKTLYPVLVGMIFILLGAFQPFDFTLDVGSVWGSVKGFIKDPLGFTTLLKDELVVLWRFVLFAYVMALFFREAEHDFSLIKGFIIVMLLGVVGEGCQFIILSRSPTVQDIVVVLVGSVCGVILAGTQACLREISRGALVIAVAVVTFVCAGVQLLHPFRLSDAYRMINMFPFLSYYERTTFMALSNFIESAMLFFPSCFVLHTILADGRSPRVAILIITLLIAVPLELAQGAIAGRYPDVTDILGALLGAIAASWCCSEGWRAFDRYMRSVTKY
ncbi:MAG: VanZ family protein [Deltaproteobacteria bacterium]|nr:VanZ family protein [Deltaproteobacteria bacterium]